jgi:dienelactone hydrolase
VKVERIDYKVGELGCTGALVYNRDVQGRRPLLLMSPNWLGVTPEAVERTGHLVGDDYIGFVADMYGGGLAVAGPPEAADLANGLRADPQERRRRIRAALDTLVGAAEDRGIGDVSRKAAVGFCFGGGNVLELARTGADLKAAVCLHGDLTSPLPAGAGDIKAALVVLHGAADPISPQSERLAFEAEMQAAKANWQMLVFGHLVHSFSESDAHVPGIAEYNAPAARQSFRLARQFVADAFQDQL